MRIAVLELHHQPHSFTPVQTGAAEFEENGVATGRAVLDRTRGYGRVGGLMQAAEDDPAIELVPVFRSHPMPNGPIQRAAFDRYFHWMRDELEAVLPVDGVFFSMHGGTIVEDDDDACGLMARTVRDVIGPDVPMVLVLDHHGNPSAQMVEAADLLVAFRTQPHDMVETGRRAGHLLARLVRRQVKAVAAFRKIPMLQPQDQFFTDRPPMSIWFGRAREMEALPGVISISTFPMQPWCDAGHSGWSVVVNTDGDQALAEHLASELAALAWDMRERFWARDGIPIKDAVDRALSSDSGLAVLPDIGDSVFAGGTGDSTAILAEILTRKLDRPALVPVIDVPALDAVFAAGLEAQVTLPVGGTVDAIFARALEVSGKVAGLSRGQRILLPARGYTDMGRTALLDLGMVKLVICEKHAWSLNLPINYMRFGLDPGLAALVVVKTASNFQHFARWQREVIRVDSPGLAQSDLTAFPWKRVRRPVWPLDRDMEWSA